MSATIRTCGLLLVTLLSTSSTATAQAVSASDRSLVRELVGGDATLDAAGAKAIQAVVDEALLKMVDAKPENALSASKVRGQFQSAYLSRPPKNEAAKQVRGQLIKAIQARAAGLVARPQVPLRGKVNVVALMAEVDESTNQSGISVPANALLLDLFRISVNENYPPALRSIALYGLERHLGYRWRSLPDAPKASVSAALGRIIDSEPRGALEKRAHEWMLRRTYDTLATIRHPISKTKALEHLTARETRPSLRLTAASYLSQLDQSAFEDAEKVEFFVGLAYLMRNHMVQWYEVEEARLKIASGDTGAMGGYGGNMGGGYGGEGGMGGGGYGGEGGMGDGGGYGGYGGMGGGGYGGGAASSKKAIDTQTWQTIAARRVANQLTQVVHLALDGTALPEADPSNVIKTPLIKAGLSPRHQELSEEFVELIDNLQNAINDTNTVTSVTTLLQGCKTPIEEIMLHVLKIPEFREKYPEILEAEGLDEIADEEDQDSSTGPDGLPGLPGDGLPSGDGLPGADGDASGPPAAGASGPGGN